MGNAVLLSKWHCLIQWAIRNQNFWISTKLISNGPIFLSISVFSQNKFLDFIRECGDSSCNLWRLEDSRQKHSLNHTNTLQWILFCYSLRAIKFPKVSFENCDKKPFDASKLTL